MARTLGVSVLCPKLALGHNRAQGLECARRSGMDAFDQTKTERIWLRVAPEVKALLEQRAKADRRKLAEYCAIRLEDTARAEQERAAAASKRAPKK